MSSITLLNFFQEAPSVDIGPDLLTLLGNDGSPSTPKTLPYAIVRGRVTQVNGIVESSTGLKGVMQIISLHEITAKRFGDSWDTDSIPPITETRNFVPFGLKPIFTANSNESAEMIVNIENPFDSIWESLLFPSSSCFTPTNSGIQSTLLGGMRTAKVLGVRKTEKFLPIDTIVTGIGQIVVDSETGQMKLQVPTDPDCHPCMLTTLPIEDLVKKFELRKFMQRVMIGVTISMGLIIVGRRMRGWWARYRMAKLCESILKERRNINLDGLCRCQTCLVCLVNPREVILLRCGHVCICADCVLKVNGICPICREPIAYSHKAYIA